MGYKVISVDHKPSLKEEKERIEETKGMSINGEYVEIEVGKDKSIGLNMTRSIGDLVFKRKEAIKVKSDKSAAQETREKLLGVVYEPFVKTYDRSSANEFLFISCDGIWDKYDSDKCIDLIRDKVSEENVLLEKSGDKQRAATSPQEEFEDNHNYR